jgi:hypothetical protein
MDALEDNVNEVLPLNQKDDDVEDGDDASN